MKLVNCATNELVFINIIVTLLIITFYSLLFYSHIFISYSVINRLSYVFIVNLIRGSLHSCHIIVSVCLTYDVLSLNVRSNVMYTHNLGLGSL